MKRCRWIAAVMLGGSLMVGGCNREEPPAPPPPGSAKPGLGSTKPPATPEMVEASKATVPPGASSRPMGSSIQTGLSKEAVQALRDFTAALGAGDAEKAKAFFISADAFGKMFKKDGLDAYYVSLKQEFDASIDRSIDGLGGATYLNYEMGMDNQAGVYEAGVTIAGATLVGRTTVAEDARAIARVGKREVQIQVPRMVLTPDGWRALQSIVVKAHKIDQNKAPQPPTGDQSATTE